MKITYEQNIEKAIPLIRDAALRLKEEGQEMWDPWTIHREGLLNTYPDSEFWVGFVNRKPAAAVILQYTDPVFWPQIAPGTSGFLHKLAVHRQFRGRGLAKALIQFIQRRCETAGLTFLRLDCAGDRSRLCDFYEKLGFQLVGRQKLCGLDTAFYEKALPAST
jgi:ribosomal protein S18 acetylase RimI-like enzyme